MAELATPAGGTPTEVAERAVGLLGTLGEQIDSVSHSSSGGDWFRDEFVGDTLSGLIGAEAAVHLLDRPLAGTEWDGYPSMGWLDKAELDDVIARGIVKAEIHQRYPLREVARAHADLEARKTTGTTLLIP